MLSGKARRKRVAAGPKVAHVRFVSIANSGVDGLAAHAGAAWLLEFQDASSCRAEPSSAHAGLLQATCIEASLAEDEASARGAGGSRRTVRLQAQRSGIFESERRSWRLHMFAFAEVRHNGVCIHTVHSSDVSMPCATSADESPGAHASGGSDPEPEILSELSCCCCEECDDM
eukprot:scaffold86376_cov31-Tisochrysis_lutea.AAC.1